MRPSQPNRTILIGVTILALIVGLGVGLLVSRAIKPSRRVDKVFAGLGTDNKEEYIVLVAVAYAHDQNLERAQAQLERLGEPDIEQWITDLIERNVTEERGEADIRALAELARGLGMDSPAVLAHSATTTVLPTPTRQPLDTPLPTPTLTPTDTPVATPLPPTVEPTVVLPTLMAALSDTPKPQPSPSTPPSATLMPLSPMPLPSDAPPPQPTQTAPPQPTAVPSNTPGPTNTPAPKWTWTARLVGPGQEGQTCSDGLKLIRVTVLDAGGNQIPGVWVHEQYTGLYQVSGHKGEDPFWGPGEAEFSGLDGGRVCIATSEGGACESDVTRDLPCHDPPPLEDLWAAGYCECCEPGITKERCQELFESGNCLGIAHYAWRVEFRRSR